MNLAIDQFPKERFGLITGSKCSVLFPDRGDGKVGQTTYARTLAKEKFFQFYDESGGRDTEHGKMGEYFALMHFQEHHDSTVEQGIFLMDGECGGSPDAMNTSYGCDWKCPTTLQKWLDYLHDGISKDQLHQCQMYMHLSGLDLWKICPYLIETQFMTDNGLTYPVKEDKRMIVIDVPKDPTWKDKLSESSKFVIEKRNEFIEIYKDKFKVK